MNLSVRAFCVSRAGGSGLYGDFENAGRPSYFAPLGTHPPTQQPRMETRVSVPSQPAATPQIPPEKMAAWQVALERRLYSCGTIDGNFGSRTQKALRAFQKNNGLRVTESFDTPTLARLMPDENASVSQVLSQEDFASIAPTPQLYREKSRLKKLGYNSAVEMAAEKFHTTEAFLKWLNPEVVWEVIQPGCRVLAPDPTPLQPIPKGSKIVISASSLTLQVFGKKQELLAHFPCSIAKDKQKCPTGMLSVQCIIPNPTYLFNPEILTEIAEKEKIKEKLVLPPGSNNPVGLVWMGLSLRGYGIHGTPKPEHISRTGSHGCFRLANWNAQILSKMAFVWMPVEIVP